MSEIKKVVVLNDKIINIGEMEVLPEGAVLEEREMEYSVENGWREVGWKPEPTSEEKLTEKDIKIKLLEESQAATDSTVLELMETILLGGM